MPSNLPKLVARTDEKTVKKFKYLATEHNRSVSQEINYLIKKEIEKYENEKGKIQIWKRKRILPGAGKIVKKRMVENQYFDTMRMGIKHTKSQKQRNNNKNRTWHFWKRSVIIFNSIGQTPVFQKDLTGKYLFAIILLELLIYWI